MRAICIISVCLLAALVIAVSLSPKDEPRQVPALVIAEYPELSDDLDSASLSRALEQSIAYYKGLQPGTSFRFGDREVAVERLTDSLISVLEALRARGIGPAFYKYLRDNFTFFESSADEVLFTGYYLASLRGSRKRHHPYVYPLYRKPGDLCKIRLDRFGFFKKHKGLPRLLRGRISANRNILPYYSRRQIDYEGKLDGRGCEILWVDSDIDRFFLMVQGSGIVRMDDGSTVRINYADCNGHTYHSIGRYLIDKGCIPKDKISMQSIRRYLQTHPEQKQRVFTHDPSYVFFREVDDGPYGCLGVPLTAFRSIATDTRVFPRGALCYIETDKPILSDAGTVTDWKRFGRLVLSQDTGGAIRGPGRVDLFCGHGKAAAATAGAMKQTGRLFFLLKR